jgi:hypothetical protein
MATIAPLPVHGQVLSDRRGQGRALRASWHPEIGALVLSMWHGNTCAATAQLTPEAVAQLVGVLADSLAAATQAQPRQQPRQQVS